MTDYLLLQQIPGPTGAGPLAVTGTGLVSVTAGVITGSALASVPVTLGGTGLTAVGAAGSVLASTGAAMAFAPALLAGQDTVALSNGINSNVPLPAISSLPVNSIRFTSYSAAIILGGLAPAVAPLGGQSLELNFTVGQQPVTIRHLDASSSAANQIVCPTGTDVILSPGQKAQCRVVWDATLSKWLLQASFQSLQKVSVRDWGAKGDGTTDDTAAIQAAVNFCTTTTGLAGTGWVLFFPPGNYLVSAQINISPVSVNPVNLILEGSGKTTTTITANAPFNIFSLIYPASTTCLSNFAVRGMSFSQSFSVAAWAANHAYSSGAYITSGFSAVVWKCTTPNSSGARKPWGAMASAQFTDPLVTLTGVQASNYYEIRLKITTGGTLAGGLARFQWSTDGGATYNGVDTAVAASVAMGATGLTANFSAGTYTANSGFATGFYYTQAGGYGFSGVYGATVNDNGVIWTPLEAAAILIVNAGQAKIEHCTFNTYMGIIGDGIENSGVYHCEFYGSNGIWIPGLNIRQNNNTLNVVQSGTTTGGNTFRDCVFNCAQLCYSKCATQDTSAVKGCTFEAGIFYGWLAGTNNVTNQDMYSEGGLNGFYVGAAASYSGQYLNSNFNTTFENCLVIASASTGTCFQLINNPALPNNYFGTSATQMLMRECYLIPGASGYVWTGADSGTMNGLRVCDCQLPTLTTAWFNNSTVGPNTLQFEDSSNATGQPAIGIGGIPQAGLDNFRALALRSYALSTLATGVNDNVATANASCIEITTTGGAFTIAGLAGGTEGLIKEFINLTGFNVTVGHQRNTSTAANRIICPGGADVVIPASAGGFCGFRVKYSSTLGGAGTPRWLLLDAITG